MTRTAIRHTFLAAAAVALAFATSPVRAGQLMNELQTTERELVDSMQTMHRALDKPTFGEKFKMGATKRGPQPTTSIISGFNSVNH